jgi:voltage-gated potassium channel
MSLRAQFAAVLHKPRPDNRAARIVNWFLIILIVANAIAVTLESVKSIKAEYGVALDRFELVSTVIFIFEYIARLWACVEQPRYAKPISGRVRYLLHPFHLLDLLGAISYLLPLDLRVLRVLRLARLLPIMHLDNADRTLAALMESLRRRRDLLLLALSMMSLGLYAAATLLYQLENAAQPQVFSSIPAAMWWAFVSFATIGYGDMAPVTALGRFVAILVVSFGVAIFAVPTAIITAAVLEVGEDKRD